jgi:hypothetical protein
MGHIVHAVDYRRIITEPDKSRMEYMRDSIVKDFDTQSPELQNHWIRQIRLIDNAIAEYNAAMEDIWTDFMIGLSDR